MPVPVMKNVITWPSSRVRKERHGPCPSPCPVCTGLDGSTHFAMFAGEIRSRWRREDLANGSRVQICALKSRLASGLSRPRFARVRDLPATQTPLCCGREQRFLPAPLPAAASPPGKLRSNSAVPAWGT